MGAETAQLLIDNDNVNDGFKMILHPFEMCLQVCLQLCGCSLNLDLILIL